MACPECKSTTGHLGRCQSTDAVALRARTKDSGTPGKQTHNAPDGLCEHCGQPQHCANTLSGQPNPPDDDYCKHCNMTASIPCPVHGPDDMMGVARGVWVEVTDSLRHGRAWNPHNGDCSCARCEKAKVTVIATALHQARRDGERAERERVYGLIDEKLRGEFLDNNSPGSVLRGLRHALRTNKEDNG